MKSQNISNSRSNKAQVERFSITLNNWSKAMSENKDVIVCMDDNIDSSNNNRHKHKYNIQNLQNMLSDHLNKFSISQCNHEYTRVVSHQQPSCIDKIYCNKPNKITNLRTRDNFESDHEYSVARYITKEPIYQPKFILKGIIRI